MGHKRYNEFFCSVKEKTLGSNSKEENWEFAGRGATEEDNYHGSVPGTSYGHCV